MKSRVPCIAVLGLLAATSAVAGDTGSDPRVIFVTSVTGDAVLGSWPDADGATGLAAADNICQNRAAAGGLANPEDFVAWISDSSDDAYCRLHGLSGKKVDTCGQPSLPADVGPWVRTDGFPFAPLIDELLTPDNVVYVPPRYDEFGNAVTWPWYTLTATHVDGTLSGNTCDDWTNTDGGSGLHLGDPTATSGSWSHGAGSTCLGSGKRLTCLARGGGAALPPFAQQGRLAFVTSVVGTGDLGSWPQADSGSSGIAAGDSVCRNLATDAGLSHPDSFKAWLSDESVDAIDRFDHDGPWVRPDGVGVAADKNEFTSGTLFTSIGQTELGDYMARFVDGVNVWTGTLTDGTGAGSYCQSWSNGTSAESGNRGQSTDTINSWTQFSAMPCHFAGRLYCLSDLNPVVFSDRFEGL